MQAEVTADRQPVVAVKSPRWNIRRGLFSLFGLFCALCVFNFLGGVALDEVADEHDDGEENQEAAAGLCAVAVPYRIAEEQAAQQTQTRQQEAAEEAEILCLDHKADHHRDIHYIQADDADLIGLPRKPLAGVHGAEPPIHIMTVHAYQKPAVIMPNTADLMEKLF